MPSLFSSLNFKSSNGSTPNLSACFASVNSEVFDINENQTVTVCGGCGSYGRKHNPNSTNKVLCAIIVDVNGDRKPTPQFACATEEECGNNSFKYFSPDIKTKKIHDILRF